MEVRVGDRVLTPDNKVGTVIDVDEFCPAGVTAIVCPDTKNGPTTNLRKRAAQIEEHTWLCSDLQHVRSGEGEQWL